MLGHVAAWVLAHRRRVAAALIALTAVSFVGISRLAVDFSFQGFVGSRDPALQYLQETFKPQWGPDDAVLLIVAHVEEGSLLSPDRIAALEGTLKALEASERIKRVGGLPRLPVSQSQIRGLFDIAPLYQAMPSEGGEALNRFRERILSDEAIVPLALSADGRAATLFAELDVDPDDFLALGPAVEKVRRMLEAEAARTGIAFESAGVPTVRAEVAASIQREMVLFALISSLVMGVLLLLLFRTPHGLFIPVTAAVLPALWLLGVLGFAGEPLGLLTQIYPSLIPVIAVADAIHVVARFDEEAQKRAESGPLDDDTRRAAIVAALGHVGAACFLTSLTTAIGFGSLAVADMVVLRAFGLYAALGIGFAYVSNVVVTPLLLDLVQRLPPKAPQGARTDRLLEGLAQLGIRRRGLIALASLALFGAALGLATRLEIDNQLGDSLSDKHPTSRANRLIDERLGGVIQIFVDLRGPPGSMVDPKVLAAMKRLEDWARARPEVRAAQGLGTLIVRLHEQVAGKSELPKSREVAAQLVFLVEGEPAVEEILSADRSRARIILNTPDIGDRALFAFLEPLERKMAIAFEGTGVRAEISGTSYVALRGLHRLSEELFLSLLSALLAIALLIALLFRSVRVCLVSLVPNLLPLALGLVAMVLLGWELNPTSGMVFCVALGIAVDDTIHVLARVYEERRRGHRGKEALVRALVGTGRALFVTSAILGLGFGINMASDFPVLRTFGALGALAIASAFVFDVLVLPALLYLALGDRLGAPPCATRGARLRRGR